LSLAAARAQQRPRGLRPLRAGERRARPLQRRPRAARAHPRPHRRAAGLLRAPADRRAAGHAARDLSHRGRGLAAGLGRAAPPPDRRHPAGVERRRRRGDPRGPVTAEASAIVGGMERILLVAASGQLGTDLARVLAGPRLVAVTRRELDVTDAAAIEHTVGAVRPAVVVNTAAFNRVDRVETDPGAAELAFRANAPGPP